MGRTKNFLDNVDYLIKRISFRRDEDQQYSNRLESVKEEGCKLAEAKSRTPRKIALIMRAVGKAERYLEHFDSAICAYNASISADVHDYNNGIITEPLQHINDRVTYASKKIGNLQRKRDKVYSTRIGDILIAPHMFEYLTQQCHLDRINNFRQIIRNGNFRGGSIMLSLANNFVQVHDGNHRLVALAIELPYLTIQQIIPLLDPNFGLKIHTKKAIIKPYHYQRCTHFQENVNHQLIRSPDGLVERMYSRPTYFRDPRVFQPTSFGRTVGEIAAHIVSLEQLPLPGMLTPSSAETEEQCRRLLEEISRLREENRRIEEYLSRSSEQQPDQSHSSGQQLDQTAEGWCAIL